MTGKEGNGGGGKTDIKLHPEPKTTEEKQRVLLENRRGQYLLLKLIDILGIKPIEGEAVGWITIGLDSLRYDLTEILEKALKDIEAFRSTVRLGYKKEKE